MSQERVLSLKKSVSTSPSSDEIGPLHQISTEDSSIHRRCVLDRAQREHKKRMIGPEDAPKGPPELESLDFDAINSPYWVDSARRPPRTLIGYSGDTFVRWLIAILIGFFVACLAKVIAVGVEIFASTRNEILQVNLPPPLSRSDRILSTSHPILGLWRQHLERERARAH